ncbi:MAG: hypothetical protein RQ754_08820 [Desulfuromonadales bacterium]|nr:hypothetical protein [Desulfuromonadales bacterium]
MVLLDTHVHIYDCFDLKVFFRSALANFRAVASGISASEPFTAVLLLTDWAGQNWFEQLVEWVDKSAEGCLEGYGNWSWERTQEDSSLYLEDEAGNRVYIVAGRKIISSENLEVLALTTGDSQFADGKCLRDSVETILEKGSVPLIPWAVGKWLGGRGKVLEQLIETVDPRSYFLCDNSNRPFFWTKPNHFLQFERKGGRILSGSDPLHFPSEMKRAGSFGCWVEGTIDADYPSVWLKALLRNQKVVFNLYGRLDTPIRFFRNQLAMQVLKKKWKSTYYRY